MAIRLLLFAHLKDLLLADEISVPLDAPESVGNLWERVRRERRVPVQRGLRFAVNEAMAGPETPVRDGDTVALLPPMSGG